MKIWNELLQRLVGSVIDSFVSSLKIQTAIVYLNLIKGARRLSILFCLLIGCAVVFACGFLLVPVGLCLFMPWSPETKAIVAVSTGAAYIIIPLIVIMVLFSQKRWMRFSRADVLLRDALGHKP
jgi:CBS domain containing-hemolysin-like protein